MRNLTGWFWSVTRAEGRRVSAWRGAEKRGPGPTSTGCLERRHQRGRQSFLSEDPTLDGNHTQGPWWSAGVVLLEKNIQDWTRWRGWAGRARFTHVTPHPKAAQLCARRARLSLRFLPWGRGARERARLHWPCSVLPECPAWLSVPPECCSVLWDQGTGRDLESSSQGSQTASGKHRAPSQTLLRKTAGELLGAPHLQICPAAHRHPCRAVCITHVRLHPLASSLCLSPVAVCWAPAESERHVQKTSLTCGTGKATEERSARPREGCQHSAWLCGIKEGVRSQCVHRQGLRRSQKP